MKYFLIALQKYTTFKGRARRAEYWTFVLYYIILFIVLYIAQMIALSAQSSTATLFWLIFWLMYILLGVFLVTPAISVVVRRLHDIGRSGWWFFIQLIPFFGPIWMLVLLLLKGDEGDNAYGPNPRLPENDTRKEIKPKTRKYIGIAFLGIIVFSIVIFLLLPSSMRNVYQNMNTAFTAIGLIDQTSEVDNTEDQNNVLVQDTNNIAQDTSSATNTNDDDSLRDFVRQSVAEAKASMSLPQQMDEFTSVVDIKAEGDAMASYYIFMSPLTPDMFTIEELREGLLSQGLCTDVSMRQALDMGVIFRYHYEFQDSSEVYKIDITSKDCR